MSEERIYLLRYVGKAKKGDKCSLEPMKCRLHDKGINVQKQSKAVPPMVVSWVMPC